MKEQKGKKGKTSNEGKKDRKGRSGTKDKTRAGKGANLLAMVPARNCKWTRQEANKDLIRLLKPRFDTKLGKALGKKMKVKPTYNINLDEFGTAAWRLFDGKLTVGEIGEMLKVQFGDTIEPLYPRLAAFLRILESNNAIILDRGTGKRKGKK